MDAAGTKELEELPAYKELLQFFITPEVQCCLTANCDLEGVVSLTCAVGPLVCFVPEATPRSVCIWLKEGCGVVTSPALMGALCYLITGFFVAGKPA